MLGFNFFKKLKTAATLTSVCVTPTLIVALIEESRLAKKEKELQELNLASRRVDVCVSRFPLYGQARRLYRTEVIVAEPKNEDQQQTKRP